MKYVKNFINVRIQTRNHAKTASRMKHDIRQENSLGVVNSDIKNVIYFENKFHYISNNDKQQKRELNQLIQKKYSEIREKHNQMFKQVGEKRNLRNRNSSLIDGVISFSEFTKNQLNEDPTKKQEYMNAALNFVNDFARENNSKLVMVSFHLDEKDEGHFHFQIENFNENNPKSLYSKMKTKEFGQHLQDKGFEFFKHLGIARGISKEITGATHTKTLKHLELEIHKAQNQYKELQDNFTAMINELKQIRKLIGKDDNFDKIERKNYYKEITDIQKYLRSLKSEIIKSKQDLSSNIDKDVKDAIEKSKGSWGLDKDLLINNFTKKLKKYSKYDIQLQEILAIKQKLAEKDAEIETLNERISTLETTLDWRTQERDLAKKTLENSDNGLLIEENKELKAEKSKYEITTKNNDELRQKVKSQEDEITTLTQKHAQEIEELKSLHNTEITTLEKKIDELTPDNDINRIRH